MGIISDYFRQIVSSGNKYVFDISLNHKAFCDIAETFDIFEEHVSK